MTGKERIAAVHVDQVGINVDAAVVQEQPEAILTFEHVSHGFAEVELA